MKPDENNNWSTGYFMGPNAPDPRFGTVRIGPEKPPSQYGFPSRANLRPTVPPPSSATFERPIEDHYLLRPEQLKPEARHTYTESVAEVRSMTDGKRSPFFTPTRSPCKNDTRQRKSSTAHLFDSHPR